MSYLQQRYRGDAGTRRLAAIRMSFTVGAHGGMT